MAEFTSLTISDTNPYVVLPKGTTAQRPTGQSSMMRYNTDTNKPEYYDGSKWVTLANPFNQNGRAYYDELARADLFTANWSQTATYTMNEFGGLGYVNAHYCPDASNSTLTLNNLPGHNKIRLQMFIHCVDSLDNETHNLYLTNNTGTETEFLRFTKVGTTDGFTTVVLRSGARAAWSGSKTYQYTPFSGQIDGYIIFDSNYYDHTSSTFSARFYCGTNEASQANEAIYLSHVKVWLGF